MITTLSANGFADVLDMPMVYARYCYEAIMRDRAAQRYALLVDLSLLYNAKNSSEKKQKETQEAFVNHMKTLFEGSQ